MKTNNSIPAATDKIISLGVKALAGAIEIGPTIILAQNTALKIEDEVYDLIGHPDTPLVPGKLAKYSAQKTAVKVAYETGRTALRAGRSFCQLAVNVLKPILGAAWNNQWNLAGFTAPSLAVPADPVPMLLQLREYFNAHPAHEVSSINITAAVAYARMLAIQSANLATSQARDLRLDLKNDRDAALKTLKARLSGLRAELDQLLSDDDGRWYDFGFRRPADGKQPMPVQSVMLVPLGPGAVQVSWPASSYAENYRVRWMVIGSGAEWTQFGLIAETVCALTALPSGAEIVVAVSARNEAGETTATEAQILVP